MGFDDLLRHTLVVKRNVPVTSGGAETVGGADTTLTTDTAPGATTLHVASAVGISDGDFLRIGDTTEAEVRIVALGGVAGLVVTLTVPLAAAHDAGDQVRELDDAGAATLDDYSQPVMAPATVATVAGLVQPRSAREVAAASQGGAAIGHFVGFLRPLAGLSTRDWIEVAGVRFDIVSTPDAAGLNHHLELGLEQVA